MFIAGGGREDNCGWLQDKWGVSWQIIPDALGRYLGDPDREKANRVMQAMFKRKSIVVADGDHAAVAWFTLTENERTPHMPTTINNKTLVSLPSDTEVRVTRDFRAPRKLVWQAHTEPQLFQRWIGGYPGWSMPVCEMDVRVGGKYRWRWRQDEDGKEFGFYGDYREVDAPGKMVQAEYYDPGSFGGAMPTSPTSTRTTFTEENGVTTLVVLIEYASKEARDGAVSTGMTDGMETSYERLDKLLAEQQGG